MTHDVERVLADIDADHGDRCVEFLRHDVLLVLSVPCQLLILAGPEHGRTIPLADILKSRWTSHYPALASRLSMRLRSASKSIGLVSSASAPRSKAFRSVSASP